MEGDCYRNDCCGGATGSDLMTTATEADGVIILNRLQHQGSMMLIYDDDNDDPNQHTYVDNDYNNNNRMELNGMKYINH
jgi:hypothetical protein